MDVRAELKVMEDQPGWKTQAKGIHTLKSSSVAHDDFHRKTYKHSWLVVV